MQVLESFYVASSLESSANQVHAFDARLHSCPHHGGLPPPCIHRALRRTHFLAGLGAGALVPTHDAVVVVKKPVHTLSGAGIGAASAC